MSYDSLALCDVILEVLEPNTLELCDTIVADIEMDDAETLTFDRSELSL